MSEENLRPLRNESLAAALRRSAAAPRQLDAQFRDAERRWRESSSAAEGLRQEVEALRCALERNVTAMGVLVETVVAFSGNGKGRGGGGGEGESAPGAPCLRPASRAPGPPRLLLRRRTRTRRAPTKRRRGRARRRSRATPGKRRGGGGGGNVTAFPRVFLPSSLFRTFFVECLESGKRERGRGNANPKGTGSARGG